MKVTVLGSGAWGTALALLLMENGHHVTMWSRRPEALEEIRAKGENPRLAGVPVPEAMALTAMEVMENSDILAAIKAEFEEAKKDF